MSFNKRMTPYGADPGARPPGGHDASPRIMGKTGLTMPLNRANRERARDFGLHVEKETDRIRFPSGIEEAALGKAPSTKAPFARNPESDVLLD